MDPIPATPDEIVVPDQFGGLGYTRRNGWTFYAKPCGCVLFRKDNSTSVRFNIIGCKSTAKIAARIKSIEAVPTRHTSKPKTKAYRGYAYRDSNHVALPPDQYRRKVQAAVFLLTHVGYNLDSLWGGCEIVYTHQK